MQLFVLVLALAIFTHDALVDPTTTDRHMGPYTLGAMWLGIMTLALLYWAICRRALDRLSTTAPAALRTLDFATIIYRYTVLLWYLVGLAMGTLALTRRLLGDQILLDELVILTPPLVLMVWSWWVYYPIDLRLRQAPLIRQLDEGIPVEPLWSRKQFILSQLRHHVALVLVPILALMAWAEIVHRGGPWHGPNQSAHESPLMMLAGAVVVFLLTPLVIRHLWDTVPLPSGPLRDKLTSMCQRYRIGVRQLLLWRTFGCVINAAVMGVFAPVRYILLTDALLERLPQERVEAVMAHEMAHIRWHHMFWLMMTAAAAMGAMAATGMVLVEVAINTGGHWLPTNDLALLEQLLASEPQVLGWLGAVAAGAGWVALFGWVSRRFERQADTFAIQYLAKYGQRKSPPANIDPTIIDPWPIRVMTSALQQVADLNHMPTHRRSWRHGSIAWRQAYLRQLVGTPIDRQPIDHQIVMIKIISAVTVIALAIGQWIVSY